MRSERPSRRSKYRSRDLVLRVFEAIESGDRSPTPIAARLGIPVTAIGRTLGLLAKMGVVRLG